MSTRGELFTIGQLAERCGVPTRTVRFWSDSGLVSPAGRSAAGYRLYDAEAVARLDLVQTLRQLGLGLGQVQAVLASTATLPEVAAMQVAALDAEIRTLRLRRAVLKTVAKRESTIRETRLMHNLARLSARERQQIIDDFVQDATAGIDPGSPGLDIAQNMRQMPADLPDEPTAEQVDAWIELGELVADGGFRDRVRAMVVAGGAGQDQAPLDPQAVMEHAGRAQADGVAPGSPAGRAVLDRIVLARTPPAERARLREQLELFTDARVERYWHLLAVVNGRAPYPAAVPAFQWLIAALRAQAA